jgi:hypothetical protein
MRPPQRYIHRHTHRPNSPAMHGHIHAHICTARCHRAPSVLLAPRRSSSRPVCVMADGLDRRSRCAQNSRRATRTRRLRSAFCRRHCGPCQPTLPCVPIPSPCRSFRASAAAAAAAVAAAVSLAAPSRPCRSERPIHLSLSLCFPPSVCLCGCDLSLFASFAPRTPPSLVALPWCIACDNKGQQECGDGSLSLCTCTRHEWGVWEAETIRTASWGCTHGTVTPTARGPWRRAPCRQTDDGNASHV